MTDAAPEPFADKAERHAELLAKLHGSPADAAKHPAYERVEKALGELDAALEELEGAAEPEAEPVTFLEAAAAAKAERKRALIDALTSRPQPRNERGQFTPTPGLDGGARKTPERRETHEDTLARVLQDGSADVGVNL
jgi:hypothetical protein